MVVKFVLKNNGHLVVQALKLDHDSAETREDCRASVEPGLRLALWRVQFCRLRHPRLVLRTWSKTQKTIAQSSVEIDLLAILRVATEAVGMISLAVDLGIELTARTHVDASAALGY